MGVRIPNSGATQLCGFMSPYPQLKGPQKNCGFEICGQNPAFEMGLPNNPKPTTKPPSSYQKTPYPEMLPKNPPT